MITLTIPNDDHIALRAFGKALEEMALAHGAEPVGEMTYKIDVNAAMERFNNATGELMQQAAPRMMQELRCEGDELQGKRKEPEIDTTAQQVEALSQIQHEIKNSIAQNEKSLLTDIDDALEQELAPTTDSTGTPWDERIHSTSKALNADGTWRLRRKPKDMDEAEWAALVESVKRELLDKENKDFAEWELSKQPDYQEQSVTPPSDAFYTPENYVHMYRAADNIYALAKSDAEVADFEADGYVRHTQEQYDAWEGPNTVDEGDNHHTDAGVVTEQTVAGIPPLPVPPPVVVSTGTTTATLEMHLPTPPHAIPVTAQVIDDWTFPKLMTFLTERQGKIDVVTVNMLLAQDGIASLPELNAHPDKIGPFVARVKAHLGE